MTEAIVQTVLGDVDSTSLGRTLPHEHLSLDTTHSYRKPPSAIADKFNRGIEMWNIGYIRQYPYSSRDNRNMKDDNSQCRILEDVARFKNYGGGTIVENTTEGLDRNLAFCLKVSQKTNVHVVVGTGYYISDVQPQDHLYNTQQDMYDYMKKELTEGCAANSSIKAGFMGEIASVWPLRDFEIRAIKAAGEVQEEVGCGVSFHPHQAVDAPFKIIRLYLEAGGRSQKAVMSHLDRTLLENEQLLAFSELGTYCQFDQFGVEVSHNQLNVDMDMPSDAQRINMIRLLVNEKKADRVLMSHDIHTKHRLEYYGGHGYSHIINNVLPKMKIKGFSQDIIDKITIENPANWLTILK